MTNTSINNLPNDADIVITHKDLTDRAKAKLPQAVHISVDNFLNSPKYDELIEKLKTNQTERGIFIMEVLAKANIKLNQTVNSKRMPSVSRDRH